MASTAFDGGWKFPDNLPGRWAQDDDDDFDDSRPQGGSQRDRGTTSGDRTRPSTQQSKASEQQRQRYYRPRTCRICLETVQPTYEPPSEDVPGVFQEAPNVTYSSPDGGRLIRPCLCKGSQKYVHEGCLAAWRLQDPLNKRNYWQCPTCKYSYRLRRMTWGRRISSTGSQLTLTVAVFLLATFVLGYVADPIINLYLDPYGTIVSGPASGLLYEEEPITWFEHFIKGFASLGLLGFAKFLLTLSPWHWLNMRNTVGGGRAGTTGRARLQQISWFAVGVGVLTFLWVWRPLDDGDVRPLAD